MPTFDYVEITVLGHVSPEWADYLSGLNIEPTYVDGAAVTKFSGVVLDQAALFGTLNGLYSLGFSLLSVHVSAPAV